MCQPKKDGGTNFKNLSCINDAFIPKLAWGILNNDDALWVRVIEGKYDREDIK